MNAGINLYRREESFMRIPFKDANVIFYVLKRHARKPPLALLLAAGFILSSSLLTGQAASGQNYHSSSTNPVCAYSLGGFIAYTTGSCPQKGTPTIVSHAKGIIPDGQIGSLLSIDKGLYIDSVTQECLHCHKYDYLKDCRYDSNGDFVAGIPLRKLSDADKAVVLDMNSSYSFPICPLKGKPNLSPTLPNIPITVIGGGSVNVRDLPGITNNTNMSKPIHAGTPTTNKTSNNANNTSTPLGTSIYNYTMSNGTDTYSADSQHAVEYLVKKGLVQTPNTSSNNTNSVSIRMPSWIKNTVSMWKNGEIPQDEFIVEIQYLIGNGMIKISR